MVCSHRNSSLLVQASDGRDSQHSNRISPIALIFAFVNYALYPSADAQCLLEKYRMITVTDYLCVLLHDKLPK